MPSSQEMDRDYSTAPGTWDILFMSWKKCIKMYNLLFIIVDVSASTEAFVGIAVRRSVSGRKGCCRCGRVGKTPRLCSSTCLAPCWYVSPPWSICPLCCFLCCLPTLPWQGEWSLSDVSSPRCYCQSMWQLIASNTVNDRRLSRSRRSGLQPCMFGCSAGYILLTLSSLSIYFISLLLYTWQMRLGTAVRPHLLKISGSESVSDATAVRSSLAVLSICHSLVWHRPCAALVAGSGVTDDSATPAAAC